MTYHTQGESQHTIFRTLFAISNDVQHPKLAIQWRILIKSALSRDVWLKIAPYPGMGKGFFVTDIVSNNPPGFHVIFRHAYLGKGNVPYRFAIIRCLFMHYYSSNTIAGKPNLLSPVCNWCELSTNNRKKMSEDGHVLAKAVCYKPEINLVFIGISTVCALKTSLVVYDKASESNILKRNMLLN